MFKGLGAGDILGIAVIVGICLIPVVTATILSYRSFRRGWWLAGPGGLFLGLWPLALLLFYGTGGKDSTSGPVFPVVMATVMAAWVALGLFLTILAVVGPKLPTLDVGEVF